MGSMDTTPPHGHQRPAETRATRATQPPPKNDALTTGFSFLGGCAA
jgi:hypothetical protein